MQPAENKDYSRDVILRLSPTRNTIIVEEQKPGGIAAYREIDPLELYYVINQSYASNDYLDSGFLPEHCLHLSMSATEKYFVLWNPELRADVIYGDREYPNFPIPRMVFGVRVLENGKVAECSMGVVADEAPTMDKQMCIMLGGISMKTAYKLLGNGEIHHLKIGKSFKIPKICVIEYLLG